MPATVATLEDKAGLGKTVLGRETEVTTRRGGVRTNLGRERHRLEPETNNKYRKQINGWEGLGILGTPIFLTKAPQRPHRRRTTQRHARVVGSAGRGLHVALDRVDLTLDLRVRLLRSCKQGTQTEKSNESGRGGQERRVRGEFAQKKKKEEAFRTPHQTSHRPQGAHVQQQRVHH